MGTNRKIIYRRTSQSKQRTTEKEPTISKSYRLKRDHFLQ